MADAFRGLTLRLGADARPLQSAISSISRSASQAQKQMNKLSKAMKLDPTSASLLESKIALVGDKALLSARAVSKIQTAMSQAVAEAKGFNLEKLANSTTDAHSNTQKLLDDYNHVNASLQHIYDAAARAAQSTEKGIDSIEKAVEWVKFLRDGMDGASEDAEQFKEAFKELIQYATAHGNIAEKFGLDKNDVDGLLAMRDTYAEDHVKLQGQLKEAEMVEGYRAMKVEAQAFSAAVHGAAAEAAKLKTEYYAMTAADKLPNLISEINLLDEATDKAVASAHQMIDAYNVDPRNVNNLMNKKLAVKTAEATIAAELDALRTAKAAIEADPGFDKLAAASEEAYVKAVKVERKYAELEEKARLLEGAAAEAQKELDELGRKANPTKEDQAQYEALEKKINSCTNEARDFRIEQQKMAADHAIAAKTIEVKKLEDSIANATVKMAALHSQTSKLKAFATVGKSFREFGFGMYASATPAMMMAGRYMLQTAQDIDAAYRDMRKTVNGTDEEFQHLLDHALEYSTTHVTTAEDLLEIESIGGQLGITVDKLESFATTVSNLDVATNMDAEDIATDLGKMGSVMGLTEDEYEKFGDALVRLGNNMPAMESDIMNLTNRFMGMGQVVGMTPDQMLAWSAAASATGQKAEAAGSAMQRFISNMETAVTAGGEDLEKWAKVAGMSADEFKQKFETDASGAMYDFVKGLGEIQRTGGSVNQTLKDLGINNVRDKQLLEGLANQMANGTDEANLLAQALGMSSDAYNGLSTVMSDGSIEMAGDAMREAEKKSEGFSGEMAKMKNQANLLMFELSEGAAPLVKNLGEQFSMFAGWFKQLPDGVKTFTIELGAMVALLGPAAVGTGTFLQSIDRISEGLVTVQGWFTKAGASISTYAGKMGKGSKAMQGLASAVSFLGTGHGAVALAGAAVAITLISKAIGDYVKNAKNFEKATEGVTDLTGRFTTFANTAPDVLEYSSAVHDTAKSFNELTESIAETVDAQEERIESAETDVARLETAKRTIEQYANTDLSGNLQAQGELIAAVDTVNSLCDTQWQVLDKVNGRLADESGNLLDVASALDDVIEKKKTEIKMEALSDTYLEDVKNLEDAVATQVKLNRDKRKAEEDRSKTVVGTQAYSEADAKVKAYQEEIEKNQEVIDGLTRKVDQGAIALGQYSAAAESSSKSVSNLAAQNTGLLTAFGNDTASLGAFSKGLEEAGMTSKEFSEVSKDTANWIPAIGAWEAAIENGATQTEAAKAAMDALGLSTRTIGEQYAQEMQDATGSTDAWAGMLETTKMDAETLASSLGGIGLSAVDVASMGVDAFNALWNVAGGDLTNLENEINLLNAANIDPKEVSITDDGLLTVNDQVIELKDNVATIGDRTFEINGEGNWQEVVQEADESIDNIDGKEANATANYEANGEEDVASANEEMAEAEEYDGEDVNVNYSFTDDGSAQAFLDLIEQLNSLGGVGVNASISVDTSTIQPALEEWNGLASTVGSGADGEVKVTYDSVMEALAEVDNLTKKISSIPNASPSVTISGGALASIELIKWQMNLLDGKTSHVYVVTHKSTKNEGNHAVGGVSRVPLIPRNAAGGLSGIVTRAMLTNQGWVGEDGNEALISMGRRNAIVPLSNRRYVRPFARAVAAEMTMGNRQIGGGDTYNTVINTTGDGSRLASTVTGALKTHSRIHGKRR